MGKHPQNSLKIEKTHGIPDSSREGNITSIWDPMMSLLYRNTAISVALDMEKAGILLGSGYIDRRRKSNDRTLNQAEK